MDVENFPAGLRVLAVDDDPITLLLLKKQLNHCNYNNVTTVTNATTALDMLRERKDRDDQFDLVISDIFMVDGIDGFKLLEHIGLEMDIPVILLSANNEKETMMRGIEHGACDYLQKPVRLEQLRNIWVHVARKNMKDPRNKTSDGNEAASQKYGDGESGVKDGASRSTKHSKKNKKNGDGAEEVTQKKQRVWWSGPLHRKFLEAIDQIGCDKAVPMKIKEVMNVEGLSRESIASHLQKYRIYVRKLHDGTLTHSNPFMDGLPPNISNNVQSGNSCESISNDSSPSGTSMHFPSSHSRTSYASILRDKMLEAHRGIPFDADEDFFKEIADGEMSGPASSDLPMQSPEIANQPLVQTIQSSSAGPQLQSPELNQPSIQIQSSSAGQSNQVARDPHQFAGLSNSSSSGRTGVPSRVADIGHIAGTSIGLTQGNKTIINQLSRLVASSRQVPSFGNEHQSQIAGLIGTTAPMVGFSEQVVVAQYNSGSNASSMVMPIGNSAFGTSSSTGPTFSNLQIGNSVLPTQMPNVGGATGNLPEVGTVDQQAVGDQVNNSNELPTVTSETQDGVIDDMDDFFADWDLS